MKIEHVAIWAQDLEQLKAFYTTYFGVTAGPKYHNPKKDFSSYFCQFQAGARLELMQMSSILGRKDTGDEQHLGLIHIAISVGSRAEVDDLYRTLQNDGQRLIDEPHQTGDGYYEFTVLDPEGNRVEVTE